MEDLQSRAEVEDHFADGRSWIRRHDSCHEFLILRTKQPLISTLSAIKDVPHLWSQRSCLDSRSLGNPPLQLGSVDCLGGLSGMVLAGLTFTIASWSFFFNGNRGGHGAVYAFLGSVTCCAGPLALGGGIVGGIAGAEGARRCSYRVGALRGLGLGLLVGGSGAGTFFVASALVAASSRGAMFIAGSIGVSVLAVCAGGTAGGLIGAVVSRYR
jgi:hypothetical protein